MTGTQSVNFDIVFLFYFYFQGKISAHGGDHHCCGGGR